MYDGQRKRTPAPRRLVTMAVPMLVVVGVLGIGAPAEAAVGETGYGGCIQTSPSDWLGTYVTADVNSYPVSNTQVRVLLNTDGEAHTYDCGTGGRPHNAPRIDMKVTYYVSGSNIACGLGISLGGDVSINCSQDRKTESVVDPYTCRNVSYCVISHRSVPFTAGAGGRIDRVDVNVSTTISGPNGSKTANSFVTAFQR